MKEVIKEAIKVFATPRNPPGDEESDSDSIESIDTTDMPELETDKEAARRQKGQGLKILTPKQMITRLLIILAQLKVGHNSQKLKNEIR